MRCAHGLCKSDSRYKHKDYMKGVEFILFPKAHENLEKCKIWVNACGRKHFTVQNVTLNTYICTKHFEGGMGPTKTHPHPIKQSQENVVTKKRPLPFNERQSIKRKCLLETDPQLSFEDEKYATTSKQSNIFNTLTTNNSPSESSLPGPSTDSTIAELPDLKCVTPVKTFNVKGTQTLGNHYTRQLFTNIEKRRSADNSDEEQHLYKMSYAILCRDDEKFKFFSGFSVKMFEVLYYFLDPIKISKLKYKFGKTSPKKKSKSKISLTDKDKLLLVLVRLRRGFTFKELGYFFGISSSMVSRISYTFIQFMYLEFKKFQNVMFQSRHSQKRKLSCFKQFKNLRIIVDCTELPIQMPKNFKEQGNTYSSYKHNNTVKFLVGIATSGAIIYVSDGYEGSQTDDVIFEELISYLVPGDVIMADRGFNVQDKLDTIKAELIIPPFLKGRSQLSAKEEILTKRIAKARIHVERMNKKIKDYRIFSKTIQNKLLPVLSQMFYIVCCLVNFEISEVIQK